MKLFLVVILCYLTVSATAYGRRKANPLNNDVGDDWPYNGPEWQAETASDKQAALWTETTSDTTPQGWYSAARMPELFLEDMSTSFDTVGDNMPQQGLFGVETRPKLIHSQGSVVPVRYVADSGSSYTGIFSGADYGLLRISEAKQADPSSPFPFVPGFGLKFLRSGVPSANLLAMYSLVGQAGYNPFSHDFTNHVPALGPDAGTAQELLFKKFETASNWPTMVALSNWAQFDQDGNEVTPVYPYRLVFHPSTDIHNMFADNDNSSLISKLAQIDANVLLYEVYAVAAPPFGTPTKIGELYTTDQFTSSAFGDRGLFFEHQRMDDDLEATPDWVAGAQQELATQGATDNWVFPDLPWS